MKTTHSLIKTALGAMVLLGAPACTTNYYDEEQYQKYLDYNSPVDSIDSRHQWLLTSDHLYQVTALSGINCDTVMILTNNPLNEKTATFLAKAKISDAETVPLTVNLPFTYQTLYAALVNKDGNYFVTKFSALQSKVTFGSYSTGIPTSLTLKPQTYTYIFEKDFPLAGDFDYNDLVQRISVERTGSKQVAIHVTIAAVGCNCQLASYIRLMDCKYDDIESVTTANGKTFNDNLPAGSKQLVNNYDILICSTKNQPVITVCADAHWAMDPYQSTMENTGAIALRKYYNTSLDASAEYESRNPVSQTYIVNFKDSKIADKLTIENLDPFLVANYNGACYETHMDALKAAQVLYNYQVDYRIKTMPWMLVIPTEKFCYPLEGIQIGFRKKTQTGSSAMFGAYTTNNHSFGQWVEDCESNLDWYNYPNDNYVWIF